MRTRDLDPGRAPSRRVQKERGANIPWPLRVVNSLRRQAVEPVIGMVKHALGLHRWPLLELAAATGEWCRVCLAFNLTRVGRRLRSIHSETLKGDFSCSLGKET